MLRAGDELAQRSLGASLQQFKKFHATRKFKAAAKAVSIVTVLCMGDEGNVTRDVPCLAAGVLKESLLVFVSCYSFL